MELNANASNLPIFGDTRLVGQRPANQGGGPAYFSVDELTDKIMGGGSSSFSRDTILALKSLRAVPPTDGSSEFIGIHPYFEGGVTCAHAFDGWSGIPNRFGSQANHFHYKARVANPAGPGAGSAGERAQMLYAARTAGDSTLNIHGYTAEIQTTQLASEHSIDTTATAVGASPSYAGTIKLRHTVNHGLTLNQRVIFRVTSAVAGIQASFFAATVTQAPALVSGNYETLVQLVGLDPNHWDASKASNTGAQNGDWVLMTLTAGEVNSANKTSLARDTSGPTDQLLITWSTAHGLSYGQAVVIWDGGITGMTGSWVGFHSGTVAEVVSTTQVRVRIRNMREMVLRSFTGTVSSATSTWAVIPGTLDPHHEVMQSGNVITGQRDATGRTRRAMVGDVDVTNDDEYAMGVGGPKNELRGRSGDLRLGGHSVRTIGGARDPRKGARFIRDNSTTNAAAQSPAFGAMGTQIGAGEFCAMVDAMLDFSDGIVFAITDTACYFTLRLRPTGDVTLETWDGTTGTSTNLGVSLLALQGARGVIALQRSATAITLWVNGVQVYSGTPLSWDRTISSAAILRVGGGYAANNRYNSTIYAAWMFAHVLTQSDHDFVTVHGRLPNALQWAPTALAYASNFSADANSWTGSGCSVAFNQTVGGENAVLRATSDNANSVHLFYRLATLVRGKRYRFGCRAYRPAANTVATGLLLQNFNQSTTTLALQLPGDTWTAISQDIEDAAVSGNNTGLSVAMINAAGAQVYVGNAADTLSIRDVTLQRLGAFISLAFDAGLGSQAVDQTGNGYHTSLTTGFEHVVPETRGTLYFRLTASGNFITAGLPPGARITSIIANAISGTPTITVGNVSAGAQFVASVTLSAGRQRLTLVGEFATSGALYVGGNATCDVWFAFNYEVTP